MFNNSENLLKKLVVKQKKLCIAFLLSLGGLIFQWPKASLNVVFVSEKMFKYR
jgi:hypothetical protein